MWFVALSLAISTAFAALCFGVSSFGSRPGRAAIAALISLVPAFLTFSGPWFFQALATLVLVCFVLVCGLRSKWAIATAVLLPLVANYAYVGKATAEAVAHIEGLRERFPIVSLDSRLQYEGDRSPPVAPPANAEMKLTPDVEKRLAEREVVKPNGFRYRGLAALHDDVSDEFVRAIGFGIERMPTVTRMIDIPNRTEAASLPAPSTESYPSADPQLVAPQAAVARPTKAQAYATHQSAEQEFLDRERMGYVESREHTVGFEPHAFVKAAQFRDENKTEYRGNWPVNSDWKIARLELVSVIKHDPPVAYVSKDLPKMDELKDAPTRSLDAFELGALSKLRRDDDVVVEESAGGVRMLGALRAGTDCLTCHRGARGDLLGAFSYELRPSRVAPAPGSKTEPQANTPRRRPRLVVAAGGRAFLPLWVQPYGAFDSSTSFRQ
jgi:hypothetical protein